MEPAGLVLGAASLAFAFKGTMDTILFFDSFRGETDHKYFALLYHIETTRLQLWGQLFIDADPERLGLRGLPEEGKQVVKRILDEIKQLNAAADKIIIKHHITTTDPPRLCDLLSVRDTGSRPGTPPTREDRLRGRFTWEFKSKKTFQEIVSKFQTLVKELYAWTLRSTDSWVVAKTLPSHILAPLNDQHQLQMLQGNSENTMTSILAATANAKSLRMSNDADAASTVLKIGKDQLDFLRRRPEDCRSKSYAILKQSGPASFPISVWIEWNVIRANANRRRYVDKINALGLLLNRASDSSLRLPPCYGIYEDVENETALGKRVGLVFGLPKLDSNPQAPRYEGSLSEYPIQTLDEIIRLWKSRSMIPSLGNRFQLALALAIAFGNLHAAGWLHKGLHSGSIIFLQKSSDGDNLKEKICITDPYITGFQYSRPANEASLSQGPLEDDHLQYYYHPQADEGFTKRRDLYGLGVLLWEIGRWELLSQSPNFQTYIQSFHHRDQWKDHIAQKAEHETGWRMGDDYKAVTMTLLKSRLPDDGMGSSLFEQQYLQKVILPLSRCHA